MKNRPLSVMFLAHTSDLGGAELALRDLVAALRRHTDLNLKVGVPAEGFLADTLRREGIPVERLPLPLAATWTPTWRSRVRHILRHGISSARLTHRLQQWRPDAVVSTTSVLVVGAMATALLRVPHIWWIHEDPWVMDYRWGIPESWVRHLVRGKRARLVFVSRYLQEIWTTRIPGIGARSAVLPQVIRVADPSAHTVALEPPDAVHLVVVGMLHPRKGQADAVRALARLQAEGLAVHLWLVGDGPVRPDLEALARTMGVDSQVNVVGKVPPEQVAAYFRSADLVLQPSHQESLGRTVLEALLLGVPVVLADLPVYRSLGLRHGTHVWKYPVGDAGALAAAVRYLVQHPDVCRHLAEGGLQWARTRVLSPQEVARRWVGWLREGIGA